MAAAAAAAAPWPPNTVPGSSLFTSFHSTAAARTTLRSSARRYDASLANAAARIARVSSSSRAASKNKTRFLPLNGTGSVTARAPAATPTPTPATRAANPLASRPRTARLTHARNDGVVVAPMTRFAARSFAEEAAREAAPASPRRAAASAPAPAMGAGDRDGREGAAWKRRLAARGWCDEDARPEDEACDAVVDENRCDTLVPIRPRSRGERRSLRTLLRDDDDDEHDDVDDDDGARADVSLETPRARASRASLLANILGSSRTDATRRDAA